MNLLNVIIKTVFYYFFILLVYRIMGKREIGKLSILDLVVSILIAEIVAISIENNSEPLLLTIIPIIVLVLLEILMAYISLKNSSFRNIIEGKPSLIINKGKINYKEMVKQRYTLDDLLLEVRNRGIKDLMDIEYAVLENNGKLSVFKYSFMNRNKENPFPLILDGIVQKDTLVYLGKDEKWLHRILWDQGYNIDNVFYSFLKNNKVYIISKSSVI